MEIKQVKTQLVISDKEFNILEQTLEMLNQLIEDMNIKGFSLIATDYFEIDVQSLNSITKSLYALTNSDELEVD